MQVEHQEKPVSTLDLCGKGFVLLTGADGSPWLDAAKVASSAVNVPVAAYRIGPEGDALAPAGTFESAAGISPRGAILVRPDDFVVWRARWLPADHQAMLQKALREALCLE